MHEFWVTRKNDVLTVQPAIGGVSAFDRVLCADHDPYTGGKLEDRTNCIPVVVTMFHRARFLSHDKGAVKNFLSFFHSSLL